VSIVWCTHLLVTLPLHSHCSFHLPLLHLDLYLMQSFICELSNSFNGVPFTSHCSIVSIVWCNHSIVNLYWDYSNLSYIVTRLNVLEHARTCSDLSKHVQTRSYLFLVLTPSNTFLTHTLSEAIPPVEYITLSQGSFHFFSNVIWLHWIGAFTICISYTLYRFGPYLSSCLHLNAFTFLKPHLFPFTNTFPSVFCAYLTSFSTTFIYLSSTGSSLPVTPISHYLNDTFFLIDLAFLPMIFALFVFVTYAIWPKNVLRDLDFHRASDTNLSLGTYVICYFHITPIASLPALLHHTHFRFTSHFLPFDLTPFGSRGHAPWPHLTHFDALLLVLSGSWIVTLGSVTPETYIFSVIKHWIALLWVMTL
jgi:hypothetical protein